MRSYGMTDDVNASLSLWKFGAIEFGALVDVNLYSNIVIYSNW
jgi:hypothetical protein